MDTPHGHAERDCRARFKAPLDRTLHTRGDHGILFAADIRIPRAIWHAPREIGERQLADPDAARLRRNYVRHLRPLHLPGGALASQPPEQVIHPDCFGSKLSGRPVWHSSRRVHAYRAVASPGKASLLAAACRAGHDSNVSLYSTPVSL